MAVIPSTYCKTWTGTYYWYEDQTTTNSQGEKEVISVKKSKTMTKEATDAKKTDIDPKAIADGLTALEQGFEEAIETVTTAITTIASDEATNASQIVNGLDASANIQLVGEGFGQIPAAAIADLSSVTETAQQVYEMFQERYNQAAYDYLVDQGCVNIY